MAATPSIRSARDEDQRRTLLEVAQHEVARPAGRCRRAGRAVFHRARTRQGCIAHTGSHWACVDHNDDAGGCATHRQRNAAQRKVGARLLETTRHAARNRGIHEIWPG
ncbi:hypothetical protein D9M70_579130 [compost metagenome]